MLIVKQSSEKLYSIEELSQVKFITPLLLVKIHHTTPSLMFGAASNTTNDRLKGSFSSATRKRSLTRVTFGGTAEGTVEHKMTVTYSVLAVSICRAGIDRYFLWMIEHTAKSIFTHLCHSLLSKHILLITFMTYA